MKYEDFGKFKVNVINKETGECRVASHKAFKITHDENTFKVYSMIESETPRHYDGKTYRLELEWNS